MRGRRLSTTCALRLGIFERVVKRQKKHVHLEHVHLNAAARGAASETQSKVETAKEKSARAEAERAASSRVHSSSSPLFHWTEVDVSNADRHIPRWQNVVFVGVVTCGFAWFGNKMFRSEMDRRRAKEEVRAGMEARARRAVRAALLAETSASVGNGAANETEEDAFEGLTPEEIEAVVQDERAHLSTLSSSESTVS